MSWRRAGGNNNKGGRNSNCGASSSNSDGSGGLYENVVPRDKTNKCAAGNGVDKIMSSNYDNDGGDGRRRARRMREVEEEEEENEDKICNEFLSGGIDRSVRARSEKRQLVDSWFSKSFQAAINENEVKSRGPNFSKGRPNGIIFDRVENGGKLTNGNSWGQVLCNSGSDGGGRDDFNRNSGENTATRSKARRPVAYRGCKTTSNLDSIVIPSSTTGSSGSEWDFLTSLNEMLRQENFIGEKYGNCNGEKVVERESHVCSPIPQTSVAAAGGVVVPLSPRPPRPLRRSERRKEYVKARSMDVAQFGSTLTQLNEEMNSCGGGNNSRPTTPTPPPGARCPSPYQNVVARPSSRNSNFIDNPSSYQNNARNRIGAESPTFNEHDYHQTDAQAFTHRRRQDRSPPPPPPPRPPKSSALLASNSAMSTSLDSIYDRLKCTGVEYNNVAMMPPQPHRPFTTLYHHQQFPPSQLGYNNPVYYYGAGSGCGPQPPPSFGSAYLPPYYANQSGSLPRVWPGGEFRSRSFGSLKGSLLGLDYEDRLLRLESDKETLHLQVSVLSDQIDAQTGKIQDLEKLLDDKKNVLETTEESLQRELLTRSSLETQKLELLTELSSLRLKQVSLERENYELKEKCGGSGMKSSLSDLNYIDGAPNRNVVWDKPPVPAAMNGGYRSGSPASHLTAEGQRLRLGSGGDHFGQVQMPQRTRTPPANAYRRVDTTSYGGTVPRRSAAAAPLSLSPEQNYTTGNGNKKGTSFSSGNINAIHYNNNSTSVDKHACWERNKSSGNISGNYNGTGPPPFSIAPPQPFSSKESKPGGHKSRGIMKILGRLRRSNSGGLDYSDQISPAEGAPQQPLGPFVRGGAIRSTAQPRLGWANKESTPPLKMPEGDIKSWDSEAVIKWLNFIGLGVYAGDVKRWVKTGQQLLDASPHELEKELGIKNHLHKKKLVLALTAYKNPEQEDNSGRLDYNWVIRWLDDIGLPQYKETFTEAKVDGRVLNYLTAEDLVSLKVTSLLHHASIKRGIQILRIHKFHPDCLCRRGGPTPGLRGNNKIIGNNNGSGDNSYSSDGGSATGSGGGGSLQVASWTNHRVMEWLRAIDLAEYAPNLRGSGVHGGLIIFEPRFNAELMATLLSIPGNKTLLRRHLCLLINELVGREIVGEKRRAELASDFVPINPTSKVKIVKKSQFPLRRKRASTDYAQEELLCPLDLCVFPYGRSDSVGQLSSLDNSFEGSSPTGPINPNSDNKEKVSNI